MKVQPMSDLHISNWENKWSPKYWRESFPFESFSTAEILILAGDILEWTEKRQFWSRDHLMGFCKRYPHVIYVPGNHEFWGTTILEGKARIEAVAKEIANLHVLDYGRPVIIEGQRFLGGTLWQPNDLSMFPFCLPKVNPMIDSKRIRNFNVDAPQEYQRLQSWLWQETQPSDIIVTHHAPSWKSADPAFGYDDPWTRYYLTPELETLIETKRPKLWVHGHVHISLDYWLRDTRVICNPKGYPGNGRASSENKAFEAMMTVEV
jgi:hypothetical protein